MTFQLPDGVEDQVRAIAQVLGLCYAGVLDMYVWIEQRGYVYGDVIDGRGLPYRMYVRVDQIADAYVLSGIYAYALGRCGDDAEYPRKPNTNTACK